jgi:hypothetical protein
MLCIVIFNFATKNVIDMQSIYLIMFVFLFAENFYFFIYVKYNFNKFVYHNNELINSKFRSKYTEIMLSLFVLIILCFIAFIMYQKKLYLLNIEKVRIVSLFMLTAAPLFYSSILKLLLNCKFSNNALK